MAVLDYGALVFKNGKLITKDVFMNMKEAVGWQDTGRMEIDYLGNPLNLKDQYFAYIGDAQNTICFYKNFITIINNFNTEDGDYEDIHKETISFKNNFTWSKWTTFVGMDECVVKPHNGYYILRWNYKGDKYKVYFGYGVDLYSYEKWHIVNYYSSLPYYFHRLSSEVKRLIKK